MPRNSKVNKASWFIRTQALRMKPRVRKVPRHTVWTKRIKAIRYRPPNRKIYPIRAADMRGLLSSLLFNTRASVERGCGAGVRAGSASPATGLFVQHRPDQAHPWSDKMSQSPGRWGLDGLVGPVRSAVGGIAGTEWARPALGGCCRVDP
jgi:hypothetical protein